MKKLFSNFFYKTSLKKIILILIGISVFLTVISEFPKYLLGVNHEVHWDRFWSIPIFFLNIYPPIFIIRSNLKKNTSVFKHILAVFYFLIFIPLVQYILFLNDINYSNFFSLRIVTVINIALLFFSFYKLFQYNFIAIILKKRKIKSNDIHYILLSYIVIGLVFGFIYYSLDIWTKTDGFRGIDYSLGTFSTYFQHIYFSFVTLATVGYGDIVPATNLIRFFVILEIITGLVLVNFILVLVISSEISNKKD